MIISQLERGLPMVGDSKACSYTYPVYTSCLIISFAIMYAGLPPELAENANGIFSFGQRHDTFKMSDVFLNKTTKDNSNSSNRFEEEF